MINDDLSQPFVSIFQLWMEINMLFKIVNILGILTYVFCTIDINLSELEYLAAHLEPFECRKLVAALHYKTYELPENIAGAGDYLGNELFQSGISEDLFTVLYQIFNEQERKIDEDIPCLRQLLHWNNSPSEGMGGTHEDLEHRLRQINRHDLANWLEPIGETEEEDPWTQVDTILMVVLVGLLGCLVFVFLALIFHRVKNFFVHKERKSRNNSYEEEERLLNNDID